MEKKLCFTKNVHIGELISLNLSRTAPGPGWLVNYEIQFNENLNITVLEILVLCDHKMTYFGQ